MGLVKTREQKKSSYKLKIREMRHPCHSVGNNYGNIESARQIIPDLPRLGYIYV